MSLRVPPVTIVHCQLAARRTVSKMLTCECALCCRPLSPLCRTRLRFSTRKHIVSIALDARSARTHCRPEPRTGSSVLARGEDSLRHLRGAVCGIVWRTVSRPPTAERETAPRGRAQVTSWPRLCYYSLRSSQTFTMLQRTRELGRSRICTGFCGIQKP